MMSETDTLPLRGFKMPARRTGVAVVLGLLAGCASEPEAPPAPIPTDGPNQVVIHVPAMT
jgi:hypothetical protein